MSAHKFQKCDKGQWNPANVELKLPIIDGHCHLHGQSLFEGSDLAKLVAKIPRWKIARFFAYTMTRDQDNGKIVLDGIPPRIGGQNKARRTDERAVAAVALLLDMGYTPLKPPFGLKFAGARGQKAITEQEQIERTDSIRTYPDRSKYRTLRLETLRYCGTEPLGDDEILIEVYSGATLLKVIPEIIIDHSDQTRQVNAEVHFDKAATNISVKLFMSRRQMIRRQPTAEGWIGGDIASSTIDTDTQGWKVATFKRVFKLPGKHFEPSKYEVYFELTYSVSGSSSSGTSATRSGRGARRWVLVLDHLRCIKKHEKFARSRDEISIEVALDGKTMTPKLPIIKCSEGKTYPIDRRMTFDSDAKIELWELFGRFGARLTHKRKDVKLGLEGVAAAEAHQQLAKFTTDGNYQLGYSVMPGEEGPSEKPFYKPDKDYLWFRRDPETFRGTIRSLSRVAARYPGQIWPLVPFDPRRPDAQKFVEEAIEDLGYVGVKLYCRCGWMPIHNHEIYGDELGSILDGRLEELYKYLCENDLPVLNHQSPTGFPPDFPDQLVLPKSYHDLNPSTRKRVNGPGFPPLGTVDETRYHDTGPRALRAEVTRQCAKFAKHCHYIQKTTSPHAWDDVLKQFKTLRLCFAHSGSDVGTYCRYESLIEKDLKDNKKLKTAFAASELLKERIPRNPYVDAGRNFRQAFIERVASLVKGAKLVHPQPVQIINGTSQSRKYTRDEIELDVRNFIQRSADWQRWLDDWEKAYPDDWTSRIIRYENQYDNIYADTGYLSGDESDVFVKLVEKLVEDAELGTMPDGKAMAKKHIVGTDWYMVALSDMTPGQFWERIEKGFLNAGNARKPGSLKSGTEHKLWKKWVTYNALDWLNLKPRLKGRGFDTLNKFYQRYSTKPLPKWWQFVGMYYDRKMGDFPLKPRDPLVAAV